MFSKLISKFVASLAAVVVAFVAFTGAAWAAVEINSADASSLETVKGIGPALSGKILAARKQGAYKDWSDLETRVSGVGEKNAAGFSRAGLTVGGKSRDGAQAGAEASQRVKTTSRKGAADGGNPSVAKK
ncbi:MAG: helix-hairpin-helix domain-containing protein [Burkholderiaceae bacterium]